MQETIKDSWNYLLDRLKSPFGGAFLLAWIVIHWKPVYYLFTADSETPVEEKIIFLKACFSYGEKPPGNFYYEIWQPAVAALCTIAGFYIFSMLAGVITGFYKRRVEPVVSKYIGSGEVVSYETYQEAKNIITNL